MEKIKIKKRRVRSPSYPLIGLSEALTKSEILYSKDKALPIPKDVAFSHLGYSPTAGFGGRVIAALKQFGLLKEVQKHVQLTQRAVDLLFLPKHEEGYIKILRETALIPTIYKDLFSQYKGVLPSDQTLKHKLITERNFNSDKVEKFIDSFRKTLKFAGLVGGAGSLKGENEEDGEVEDNSENEIRGSSNIEFPNVRVKAKGNILKPQSFDIPLLRQNKATITIQKLPVEKTDIERLKKWIDLMEDSLIESEEANGVEES